MWEIDILAPFPQELGKIKVPNRGG